MAFTSDPRVVFHGQSVKNTRIFCENSDVLEQRFKKPYQVGYINVFRSFPSEFVTRSPFRVSSVQGFLSFHSRDEPGTVGWRLGANVCSKATLNYKLVSFDSVTGKIIRISWEVPQ